MLQRDDASLTTAEQIQRHPPERGGRRVTSLVLYSGCSCCCCCLHSLGGIIGSAVAGNYRAEVEESPESPIARKRFSSVQGMYWSCVAVAVLSGMLIIALMNVSHGSEAVFVAGFVVAIFGPLFLLAACILTALLIAVCIDDSQQRGYWKQLGKIVLGIVLGSVLGGLVMMLLFFR